MLRENHVNIESKNSQLSYTDFMMNMNLLAVVAPPSIYQLIKHISEIFFMRKYLLLVAIMYIKEEYTESGVLR